MVRHQLLLQRNTANPDLIKESIKRALNTPRPSSFVQISTSVFTAHAVVNFNFARCWLIEYRGTIIFNLRQEVHWTLQKCSLYYYYGKLWRSRLTKR